jgi:hypothetical protein
MIDPVPIDGQALGVIEMPDAGWGRQSAKDLDDLVVTLWSRYGWDHLRILMHPDAWGRVAPFLTHNQNGRITGRKGVDCSIEVGQDRRRIVVVYKSEPTEYVPM